MVAQGLVHNSYASVEVGQVLGGDPGIAWS